MNVHQKIKALRTSKKFTQQKFANAIGISRSSLAQIELGKSKPTYDIMNSIVTVFKIDANSLFHEIEEEHPEITDNETAKNVVNFYNRNQIDPFTLLSKHNALKHTLSKVSDYKKLENLESAVSNTSNLLTFYHSQFIEAMFNDINPVPPYVKDFQEFAVKYRKEIKGFKNIISTYESALVELEKANTDFEKKHDFLNVYDLPKGF